MNAILEKPQVGTGKPAGRDLSVDLLKVIAIIGVIFIHNCGISSNPTGSFPWLSSLFWGSVSRASVPIFLMCSGALMLSPRYGLPLKKLYSKNLLRIVAAMIVWAMMYKVYHLYFSGNLSFTNIVIALKNVLLFDQEFHLYYLHIIIIVYLFLPVTRLFVAHAEKKDLQYFLAVWFVFGILYPTVRGFWPFNLITGIPVQWIINMTYASIGYGVLGYYLKTYVSPKRIVYIASALAGFMFIFAGTWYISVKRGSLYSGFLEGMSVGVALMAAGIFGFCVSRKSGAVPKYAPVVKYLSKASFCIYLVHIFSMYLLNRTGLKTDMFTPLLSIPVVVAAVFAISLAVYAIISKIPVVNKWLI